MSNGKHRAASKRSTGRIRPIRESAPTDVDEATAPTVEATETAPTGPRVVSIVEASTGTLAAGTGRRYKARLIEGDRWGSSGFYPRKVLERDGPKVFPTGTHMYLDHPTDTEESERPERSVKDLAGTIVTTPAYEGDGLYATIEVFPHAQPLIESLGPAIGLSIRGAGTADYGTIKGRTGTIFESLTAGQSVDFVTRAGAGGAIISLAEAARTGLVREAAKRTLGAYLEAQLHLAFTQMADDMYGHGRLSRPERLTLSSAIGDGLKAFTTTVEKDAPQLFARDIWDGPGDDADASESTRIREASSNEIQAALSQEIRSEYGQDGDVTQWICVMDFDPDRSLVWFSISDNQSQGLWQQGYKVTDTTPIAVGLVGDRTQVVARTEYLPAPADDTEASEAAAGLTFAEALSNAVKSQFQKDIKRDTPTDIAAGIRRLTEWAASGSYPQGTSYEDLKWFYDQCAAELKRRDKGSDAGGNFPDKKTDDSKSTESARPAVEAHAVDAVECHALTVALKTIRGSSKEAAGGPPTSVTDGAPPTAPTQPIEETSMSGNQTGPEPGAAGTTDTAVSTAVTEAQTLRAAAETRASEAERENTALKERLARHDATESARPIITALLAESQIATPAAQAKVTATVLATLPLTEALALDEAKLREATTAAITEMETVIAEALAGSGAGSVSGLGGTTTVDATETAAFESDLAARFGRLGMSEAASRIAAGGRR